MFVNFFVAGNLATGVSNDGFMEVNSGAVQQPNHLLTHRVSKLCSRAFTMGPDLGKLVIQKLLLIRI